ncbi:MAG: hypothetical protein QOC71_1602, partial [Thermoplasmata archaeon]|nr:hypothetical protein [Thermoplasmata archaeon]
MRRPVGKAAVRLSFGLLVFAAFLLGLVQPVGAGTLEAPEIQDPANDQAIAGEGPGVPCGIPQVGCAAATRIDATSIWIDTETATTINVNIVTTGVPGGATSATSTYNFHATFGGTEVISTVVGTGGATVAPPAPGANVESVTVDGNTLILTIAKSVYGAPTAGASLTNLFYEGLSHIPSPVPALVPVATDRAPNEGAG